MRSLCTLSFFLFILSPIFATTFHVPGDFPTIQSAISGAANGDVIVVASGTYEENIRFEGKAVTVTSQSGPEVTSINGNQSGPVVSFDSHEGTESILDGFTIENGNGTICQPIPDIWGYCGGGIYCQDASPTVRNNRIIENWGKLVGGGICITGSGTPFFQNNKINSNRSTEFGGGVFAGPGAYPVFEGNTFKHNKGGALLCYNCTPTITENIITENEAPYGSGIYVLFCPSINITGNTITFNHSFFFGGGIQCSWTKGLIELNSITDNTHGGIGCKKSILTISKNTITGNRGSGGISASFDSTVRIEDNIINFNLGAGDFGGGVWCGPDAKIKHNFFYRNESDNYGGAIHAYGTAQIIENMIIENTAMQRGGGICLNGHPDGYEVIKGNTITKNSAARGGGIWCDRFPSILENTITDNASVEEGGGICSEGESPGGHPDHLISKNIISGNTTLYGNGGGISLLNATSILKGNEISGNSGGNGGGISIYDSSPTLTENNIKENAASNFGGGIYCFLSHALITGNTIRSNFGTSGGALMLREDKNSVISNNTVCCNNGLTGGGICAIDANAAFVNNTVADNSAQLKGGGMACRLSDLGVSNMIFAGNSAPEGPEIWLGTASLGSTMDISYSLVEGGQSMVFVDSSSTLHWGDGMVTDDPLFVDRAENDYHILYVSPCRGTGLNATTVGHTDIEGDPRITLSTVDMGADEFHHHLYCTGDFKPEGVITAHIIGPPGADPIVMFIGADLLDTPASSAWGEFYLEAPFVVFGPLGTISTLGIVNLPSALPVFPPTPYDIHLQTLVGDKLTNLFTLEVR